MKRFLLSHIPIIDRVGILVSSMCMVHCLALPVILPLLSLSLQGAEDSLLTHSVIAALVIPATLYAAWSGYRQHRTLLPVVLFMLGASAILIGIFVAHDALGESAEQIITVFGSILLIVAHVKNYRLQHICNATCFVGEHTTSTSSTNPTHLHNHDGHHNHEHIQKKIHVHNGHCSEHCKVSHARHTVKDTHQTIEPVAVEA